MKHRLAHVGLAVADLDAAVAHFRDLLGLEERYRERVDSQGVLAVMLGAGEAGLELLAPVRDDSPVGKFLARRGEGIHHVAIEVDDVDSELRRLDAAGVALVDRVGREGAGGCRVGFLHPKASRGILVELVERPRRH